MSPNELRYDEGLAAPQNPPRLDRSFVQDPHALYRRLRAEGPAHRVVVWGTTPAWLITRYAEARAALTDPRLIKDWRRVADTSAQVFPRPHNGLLNSHMLQLDPPDHTRLRKLVMKAFTAGSVQQMRPDIVAIADELLDVMAVAAAAGETVDLMPSYAVQLPLAAIGKLLGVPPDDRDRFRASVEPMLTTTDPAELDRGEGALVELLTALISQKREHPADDLLSALVHASDVDDRLSRHELVATAFLLIVAGYETTVSLIGNGINALLRNPSQLAALRDQPARMPFAVEEFLRFESPLNMATVRMTTAAVRVGDVEIPAGELVLVALLSANHDSRQFADPDQLDVTRIPNPHLAFGRGIHHCLGAPLARLEGEIAIGRLLARFDRITLDHNSIPCYRNSSLMRGLTALPVRLGERR